MAILSCDEFTQFLVDQQPVYDKLILADIRPTDSWIGNVSVGTFPSASGVEHRLDRFRHVFPNTTKQWSRTEYTGCVGTPCDKTEYCIGWGSERITYFLEEQSWATQLLCFDQLMHVTHAQEQFRYIISDILRPATMAIMSNFFRKRALDHAGKTFIADTNLTEFTFEWSLGAGDDADGEIYFDTSAAPDSVCKLVPQHLMRRFHPLMLRGYGGKNPFKETAPFIELVTGMETLWELDKLGGSTGVGGVPSVSGNWRFTQWGDANKYWRYGFSGQIGNFLVRVDTMELRFNFVQDLGAGVGANRYRYQIVLPYTNETTSGAGGDPGLGSVDNPDYQDAQFAISFIWHKKGLDALVADANPINPEMPFSSRNFGGRWQFVMDNLGVDVNDCVIENKRRNKGQFIADFKLAIRPLYNEFINAFFHKREPVCIPCVDTCNADPGYPTQSYDSCNEGCD
jgi:hypothetical protein